MAPRRARRPANTSNTAISLPRRVDGLRSTVTWMWLPVSVGSTRYSQKLPGRHVFDSIVSTRTVPVVDQS